MLNVELERQIVERLQQHELRYTSGRRAIVEGLRGAGAPLTLPELLGVLPGIPQSSAYRNLAAMETAGVVRRLLHSTEHARYELAESLTEHHHHLVCEECGVVRDITLGSGVESELERSFAAAAHEVGFVAQHHTIDVYGVCEDCVA